MGEPVKETRKWRGEARAELRRADADYLAALRRRPSPTAGAMAREHHDDAVAGVVIRSESSLHERQAPPTSPTARSIRIGPVGVRACAAAPAGVPAPGWDGECFTDRQVAADAIGGEHGRFLLDVRAWVRALVAGDMDCDVRVMKVLPVDDTERCGRSCR